jgi:maltose 6'-phosphate phosphatase
MRVLTVNVHGWIEENTPEKIKRLAKTIAEKDYEVIAMQEVNQPLDEKEIEHPTYLPPLIEEHPIPLKEKNYAKVLLDELAVYGKKYYWSWSANHIGYDKYDEGLAILTKNPQQSEAITVSETFDYTSISTRNVLKTIVTIADEEWTIFNGHFSWWRDMNDQLVFKNEWDNVKQHFTDIDKKRVLFMGDFNNESNLKGKGYDYLLETAPFLKDGYVHAEKTYGEATVPAGIDGWKQVTSGKRIDYIFLSQELLVKECNVIFDGQNEPIISDHYGVEILI